MQGPLPVNLTNTLLLETPVSNHQDRRSLCIQATLASFLHSVPLVKGADASQIAHTLDRQCFN